jgi:hypothetical protein
MPELIFRYEAVNNIYFSVGIADSFYADKYYEDSWR